MRKKTKKTKKTKTTEPIEFDVNTEDFEAVAEQYGIPRSDKEAADQYRLAVARAMIRAVGLKSAW